GFSGVRFRTRVELDAGPRPTVRCGVAGAERVARHRVAGDLDGHRRFGEIVDVDRPPAGLVVPPGGVEPLDTRVGAAELAAAEVVDRPAGGPDGGCQRRVVEAVVQTQVGRPVTDGHIVESPRHHGRPWISYRRPGRRR